MKPRIVSLTGMPPLFCGGILSPEDAHIRSGSWKTTMISRVADPLPPDHHLGDVGFLAVCRDLFNVRYFASSLADSIHKFGACLLTYYDHLCQVGLRTSLLVNFLHTPLDLPQTQTKKVPNQAGVVAEIFTP